MLYGKKMLWAVFAIITLAFLSACGGGGGSGTDPSTNSDPIAAAGANQNVPTGSTVTLDGSASHDPDGDRLSYLWSFTSKPPESLAILSDNKSVKPTFIADFDGEYILELTVDDGTMAVISDPVTVTAATGNSAPVANAGPNQNVATGSIVVLDGSGSSDANGDFLTYSWSFTSRPDGSSATLSNSAAFSPTFTADLDGTYILSLIVNDGLVSSSVSTVNIRTVAVDASPNSKRVVEYSAHPNDSSIVFVTTSPDFIGDNSLGVGNFISMDSGSIWQKLSDGWLAGEISYSPHNENILVASPYISIDKGLTWSKATPIPSFFESYDLHIFIDPNRSDVIYGVSPTVILNPHLYQSSNLGETWKSLSLSSDFSFLSHHNENTGGTFGPSIFTSNVSSNVLGVIYDGKVFLTNTGGDLTSSEYGLPIDYQARFIGFDPTNADTVRIELNDGSVYESFDSGSTWSRNNSLTRNNIPSGVSIYSWESNLSLTKYSIIDEMLYRH